MNFKLINNHILLTLETNLGDKVCVFDTGSPLTFFFDNVSEYSIDGKAYSVRQNPMAEGYQREAVYYTKRGDIDRANTQTRYAEDVMDKYKTQLKYASDADDKAAMYLRWVADALSKQ